MLVLVVDAALLAIIVDERSVVAVIANTKVNGYFLTVSVTEGRLLDQFVHLLALKSIEVDCIFMIKLMYFS